MELVGFNKAVEFAMQQGLPASQAIEFVAFMNHCFPEDMMRQSRYCKEWIQRWKNEPLAHMDDACALTYSLILTVTSVFVESL